MSSNNPKQHQILNELYIQACADLLPAYGLEIDIRKQGAGTSTRTRDTDSYLSILGATTGDISLSSMLKIDRDLVVSIHPAESSDVAHDLLEDWCRELNNQLVGRLKNKLLGYGQALILGLPTLITGIDVRPVPAPNSKVHEYSVESGHGKIALTLVTLVSPGLELREVEAVEGEAVLLEGAIALF
jgi:hypothetical protein